MIIRPTRKFKEEKMMFNPDLEIDQVIDNATLCHIFQCSPQGGMRRSKKTKTLVLTTDCVKGIYHDRWIDGVLHYTGMGQVGDQDINYRQNKTLLHAKEEGIGVFLFKVMVTGRYTYCGKVELVDKPYSEMQLDMEGNRRLVWIFPIKPVCDEDIPVPAPGKPRIWF